jgi:hypothetical protein
MQRHMKHRSTTDEAEPAPHRHGSAVPKLLAIVMAVMLMKVLARVSRQAGSPQWRERRHAAIADIHRRLHEEDAAAA